MIVEIDGKRYVPERNHLIGMFNGEPLHYGKIIWHKREKFYNISVSHIAIEPNGVYFIGTDGRNIPIEFARLTRSTEE